MSNWLWFIKIDFKQLFKVRFVSRACKYVKYWLVNQKVRQINPYVCQSLKKPNDNNGFADAMQNKWRLRCVAQLRWNVDELFKPEFGHLSLCRGGRPSLFAGLIFEGFGYWRVRGTAKQHMDAYFERNLWWFFCYELTFKWEREKGTFKHWIK
jgi:hypothetical protein